MLLLGSGWSSHTPTTNLHSSIILTICSSQYPYPDFIPVHILSSKPNNPNTNFILRTIPILIPYLGIPILTGLRVCPTTTSMKSNTFSHVCFALDQSNELHFTKKAQIPREPIILTAWPTIWTSGIMTQKHTRVPCPSCGLLYQECRRKTRNIPQNQSYLSVYFSCCFWISLSFLFWVGACNT